MIVSCIPGSVIFVAGNFGEPDIARLTGPTTAHYFYGFSLSACFMHQEIAT